MATGWEGMEMNENGEKLFEINKLNIIWITTWTYENLDIYAGVAITIYLIIIAKATIIKLIDVRVQRSVELPLIVETQTSVFLYNIQQIIKKGNMILG